MAGKDGEEENMAAWLLGIKNLKIQPFVLPPLGNLSMLKRIKDLLNFIIIFVSSTLG